MGENGAMTFHPIRFAAACILSALLAFSFQSGVGLAAENAVACTGADMRPELEREKPGSLEAIREAAARTPNGDARLWRIETAEGAVSHLYGTMHVSNPDVVRLGPKAQAAYDDAKIVVIETTDVLDEQKAAASLWAKPELMVFTDGTSLLDHMDDEEERVLDEALRERGMTLSAMKTIKPWILAGSLSLPACELGTARQNFLDIRLARDAQDEGREIAGLETALEQIEAIAGLPLDFHVDSLVDSARLGDLQDDVFATIGALYAEGRIGEIWPFLMVASESLGGEIEAADEAALAGFNEAVITRRNYTMAERAAPIIENGGAFIAVGALHIPGEEGVVELLRERGYDVERVAP